MATPLEPFDYVVFGATGDLTMRKLLPALYWRYRDGQMPKGARVIGTARSALDDAAFRDRARDALGKFIKPADLDPAQLAEFLDMVFYVSLDGAKADADWSAMKAVFADAPPERVRVFYLATSPELYGDICRNLSDQGLVTPAARVVLEKPIGHDLASARAINDSVGQYFAETQIFRIDHYLGKETVQNLIALRFANPVFERLWDSDAISSVQITAAETVGVESRAAYYDHSGALRDMIQNHLLQVMCLVAMEPPASLASEDVHIEKLKVLHALKPITPGDVGQVVVRGQYASGEMDGKPVPGYVEELGHDSNTETFVALRAEVHSWRWGSVPFYLRSGKRLPNKVSEIVITFRRPPWSIFPNLSEPNKLVIRLQPEEGIELSIMSKDPTPDGMTLRPADIDISFEKAFGRRYPDAYERLLMDTVRGDSVLFMRRAEVEAAWTWVQPILDAWKHGSPKPYKAGTWGPEAAKAMLDADNRRWHEDMG
jgi:glucose-6-phosphate 1-dehydrogenase